MCSCGRNAMLSAQPTPQSTEIAVEHKRLCSRRGAFPLQPTGHTPIPTGQRTLRRSRSAPAPKCVSACCGLFACTDLIEPQPEVIRAIVVEDSPCLLHGL